MLKQALTERTKELTDREAAAIAAGEFNPYLEMSDLTTTHEAFQFLLRRYVEEGCDSEMGTFVNMEKLRERHKRRLSLQPPTIEMEKLLSPETEEKRDKAFDKLKSFIRMKNEHDEEKKFEEATKIMQECLEVKPRRNKYNPNRRRSSILLHIQRDFDEEMDDMTKKRSGSRSRRNSSIGLGTEKLRSSTQNLKASDEDLQSSSEALILPPTKPRSRRGSSVGLETKKDSDGSNEGLTLPDIDSTFKRSGSRKSKKKKKNGDKDPYPKRKGSFRRYSLVPDALTS